MSVSLEIYKEVINTYFPESYFWTKETVPPAHSKLYDQWHGEPEIQQYLKSRYAHHLKVQADRALVRLANMNGAFNATDVTALKVLLETSGILDMNHRPQAVTVTHYIPSPYAGLEVDDDVDTSALV